MQNSTPSGTFRALSRLPPQLWLALLVGCAPFGPVRDALHSDAWVQSPEQFQRDPSSDKDSFRWRRPTLDVVQIDGPYDRLAMNAALYHQNAVVATNAAIALARIGQDDGKGRLVSGIRNRNLKLPLRLAAAEALASLSDEAVLTDLHALIDECEAKERTSVHPPEIHAELLYGLAQRDDPASLSCFERALDSPAAEVRRAALHAWGRPGVVAPPAAIALCNDPQPRVREAALAAVARAGSVAALQALRRGVRDNDPDVRLAAVKGLGAAASPEANAELSKLLRHPSSPIRAAAVRALAAGGDGKSTAELVGDPQWEVRKALAETLALHPHDDSVELACSLLDDSSGEVQLAVIEAVSHWPAPQAGPVLIAAIERPEYRTRQNAAAALVKKWPAAAPFQAGLERDDRASAVASLRTAWESAFGSLPSFSKFAATAKHRVRAALPRPSPETLSRVRRLLDDLRRGDERAVESAAAQLIDMGDDLLPAVEWIASDLTFPIPDLVYERVLPQVEPAFAAAERLRDRAVQVRRNAASELRAVAQKSGLSKLAIDRIANLASLESDELVLIAVLYAVRSDPRAAALHLALAAAGHAAPEVRRLAVEHLGEFGSSRHVQLLLVALEDPNTAVVVAALRALSKSGVIDDSAAIERLLASPDKNVRVEAATTLVWLGASAGVAALERLAHDPDPKVCRRAIQSMAATKSERFTPTLLELLSASQGVGDAALAALPACAGRDICAEQSLASADRQSQIAAWRTWGERKLK